MPAVEMDRLEQTIKNSDHLALNVSKHFGYVSIIAVDAAGDTLDCVSVLVR